MPQKAIGTKPMMRPSRDDFYRVALPRGPRPGRLLRHRELNVPGVDADAWQLVYGSQATDGSWTAISGTVLVPRRPWTGPAARPLLSYGVGIHGLGRDYAPSFLLAIGREPERDLIDLALHQGWAVAVTDGEGLGMPGPHTYGAARVGGRAVLDITRAARELPGVAASSPVLLWGYSEGGRCVAAAADLQPEYAPEVDLVAAAAGAVPCDLRTVVRAIDGGPHSGLGLAVLIGLAHGHRDARLWDILNPSGLRAAQHASGLGLAGLLRDHPQPLAAHTVRSDPWEDARWRRILDTERSPFGRPRIPLYLYHSTADEIIPRSLRVDLARSYEALGVQVSQVDLLGVDHLTGSTCGAPGALSWLELQLALRQQARRHDRPA